MNATELAHIADSFNVAGTVAVVESKYAGQVLRYLTGQGIAVQMFVEGDYTEFELG